MRAFAFSVHRDMNTVPISKARSLVHARRAATFAVAVVAATLLPRAARAADWNDDAPPSRDAASAQPAPPDHASPEPARTDHDYRGYDVAIRPFALVMPSGALDRSTSFSGLGSSAGLAIGAYPTRHLGLYLAAEVVTQHADDATRDHYSLLQSRYTGSVEIAFDSRRTGFYLAPGLAFVTASLDRNATYTGVDVELRAGFRIAPNPTARPTLASLNIFAGVDYGRYAALSARDGHSQLAPADRADHAFFFVGIGIDLTR